MNNLVTFNNDIKEVTTTTLKVAEVFGKRHDRVLRAVNKILGDIREAEDFNQAKNGVVEINAPKNGVVKFGLATYTDSKGEHRKHYILNKEAFYLLVMGFTGKKALQFKLDFINAFNQKEKALNEKTNLPTQLNMKAIGGMIKKCCAVAVRDEITKMKADDNIYNLVAVIMDDVIKARVQDKLSKIKALLD